VMTGTGDPVRCHVAWAVVNQHQHQREREYSRPKLYKYYRSDSDRVRGPDVFLALPLVTFLTAFSNCPAPSAKKRPKPRGSTAHVHISAAPPRAQRPPAVRTSSRLGLVFLPQFWGQAHASLLAVRCTGMYASVHAALFCIVGTCALSTVRPCPPPECLTLR
jgi:hypothetical protein